MSARPKLKTRLNCCLELLSFLSDRLKLKHYLLIIRTIKIRQGWFFFQSFSLEATLRGRYFLRFFIKMYPFSPLLLNIGRVNFTDTFSLLTFWNLINYYSKGQINHPGLNQVCSPSKRLDPSCRKIRTAHLFDQKKIWIYASNFERNIGRIIVKNFAFLWKLYLPDSFCWSYLSSGPIKHLTEISIHTEAFAFKSAPRNCWSRCKEKLIFYCVFLSIYLYLYWVNLHSGLAWKSRDSIFGRNVISEI